MTSSEIKKEISALENRIEAEYAKVYKKANFNVEFGNGYFGPDASYNVTALNERRREKRVLALRKEISKLRKELKDAIEWEEIQESQKPLIEEKTEEQKKFDALYEACETKEDEYRVFIAQYPEFFEHLKEK